MVCPAETAWELHKAWPEADFQWVKDAGHSANGKPLPSPRFYRFYEQPDAHASEDGIRTLLLDATDKYADTLSKK